MSEPSTEQPSSDTDSVPPASASSSRKMEKDEYENEYLKEHKNLTRRFPNRFREDPLAFLRQINAYYQGTGWRGYNYYLGQPILFKTYSTEMKQRVIESPRLRSVIHKLAKEKGALALTSKRSHRASPMPRGQDKGGSAESQQNWVEEELHANARDMVNTLCAELNSVNHIKLFAFIINIILARMYPHGIFIRQSELMELRHVANKAAKNKHPLIFLPSHKSHLDYLVISFLLMRTGIALPHIAAGNNLDLPLLGKFLKGGGAFFIKRTWAGDPLYASVVSEYIQQLLECGHNIECYIEGTRSRTGKLLPPKLGILKIILDYIISPDTDTNKDAIIVPVSIGYDKVIETEGYANELLGNPKERESLWGLFSSTHLLHMKMGRIDVGFGKAFSMREFIAQQTERRSPFNPHNPEDKKILLLSFGYRILADINAASVVMPTSLVGTVLLTLRSRGVARNELIRRVEWLRREILAKGGNVADFGDKTVSEIVERAIEVLKGLVAMNKEKDLLEPIYYATKRFELSYYRNQLMHLFVPEAILSVSLYTQVKFGGSKSTQRMPYTQLLDKVIFLSSLLKLEFVYQTADVRNNLDETLEYLLNKHVLTIEGDMIGLSDMERTLGRENYDFYCFLIWPFVETYWLATMSLFALAPPYSHNVEMAWMAEKIFFEITQSLGQTLYWQGDLSYLEAVSKETLRNALDRLEYYGIVTRSQNYIALHPSFAPKRDINGAVIAEGPLWDFAEEIGEFRREGKNRRDDNRGKTRVLHLIEVLHKKSKGVLIGLPPSPALLNEDLTARL
ncbi:uncharacterized protein VTP21DRAFT_952 [Calcarisporiella thermophila]|uniref:uncharacterized protein n=1 Tax=Calcarisporiella thermophila TaxID=911321 RepID=UPI003741F3FA